MDYKTTAAKIVELVGGKENISAHTHCMTRLRLVLKDSSKAKIDELKKVDGIKGVVNKGGQYQIVIGPDVEQLYNELAPLVPSAEAQEVVQENLDEKEKETIWNRILSYISGSVTPALPVLIGSGMISAILALCANLLKVDTSANTYVLFNALANAAYTYLPVLVAFAAARRLKTNEYVAAFIMLALCLPTPIEKTRVNGRGTYYCPRSQKKEPIVIALTGSIGSGKSEVCACLRRKGYPVASCDEINSRLLEEPETLKRLAEILDCPAEQLDRKYIASRIFSDESDRRQVEQYLHGQIMKRIRQWISENEAESYLFVEVPLLFEAGWDRYFDYSLLVYADEKVLYDRLKKNRSMTPEQVRERLSAQMSVTEKLDRCDGSIANNATLEKLQQSVERFLNRLPSY